MGSQICCSGRWEERASSEASRTRALARTFASVLNILSGLEYTQELLLRWAGDDHRCGSRHEETL